MWTPTLHSSTEQNAALSIAALGALYATYSVVSALLHERAIRRALDDQGLYRPPTTLPVLGNTLDVMRNKDRINDWFKEQSEAAGGRPWVLSILGRPQTIVLTSDGATEDVFKTQFDIFEKGPDIVEIGTDFFGKGIIAVERDEWKEQRRTASHLFSMQMMRDVMDAVVIEKSLKLREVLTQCARQGKPVPMKSMLSKFTSDVFTKIGFGVDLHGLDGDVDVEMDHPFLNAVASMGTVFQSRLQSPMWLWRLKKRLNIGDEAQLRKDAKVVQDLVQSIIADSLESSVSASQPKQQKNLLTLFVESSGVSDVAKVRDIGINFFFAGKDTTSFSLSWVIVNLNRYPRVLRKMREEMRANLPELVSGELEAPAIEDLAKLPYLEAVLRESVRLYMNTVHRAPNKSTTLSDGTFIPFGTHVIVPVYAMSRMKTVWGPDAEEFRPERWIDEHSGKVLKMSPFKFFSFLAGPRQCIGMRFAMLEMQTVLAVLFSRLDISTVEDPFAITYDYSLVVPVKGPLLSTIREVSSVSA